MENNYCDLGGVLSQQLLSLPKAFSFAQSTGTAAIERESASIDQ